METNIGELLYEGLENTLCREDFYKESRAVNDAAFKKIISDINEGKIQFKRDLSEKVIGKTEAKVKNYKGIEVNVPVVFFITASDNLTDYYLRIGDRNNGPCYSGDEVRKFADFFGMVR